jgi:Circadian oscillating protein COP23
MIFTIINTKVAIMKKHFSSISTSILLSLSFAILNCTESQARAVSIDRVPANLSPSSQLVSQNESGELENQAQFTCASTYNDRLKKRVPTTIAWNGSGKRAFIQWVKQMDKYWTPEKRCQEVSQRMQEAYTAGTFKYLTNGKMNGQRVICTTTEINGDCKNLLMTLRPEDKPLKFMNELTELFNSRSDGPIEHSSGERRIYIRVNLNQMWKNAPSVR